MSSPSVVIAEPLAPQPVAWLAGHARLIHAQGGDREALKSHLADAQGLIVRTYTIVDDELLDHAPNLKVVARAGAGLDNIDLDACRRRGIPVVHTPESNTRAVAEYVIEMILTTLRPIAAMNEPVSDRQWHALREASISQRSCVGARLGIIGLGKIGSRVAGIGHALGMEVLYNDVLPIEPADRMGAMPSTLHDLARTCEVISIHVDGSESNRHLVDESVFSMLRDDVVLINAARGFVIDPAAAAAFAAAHRDARLILDVHDPEPIAADSPLPSMPNVICTPHIGAGTRAAKEQMSWVVRDVVRVLNGEPPHHAADW
ncbi:MAG: NAD(P)-dependent oxidoreductase [Phycisphaerales bacterium]